ncbi:hypothetical protein PHJA_000985800 [Phtheirospermum japonicum]|uniref:Uncharacterized protein n=1 Tax=Phtheirospermum japonicum TaxID=374723 RepID=A0A830C299_9LAMI|nr:hypothetical protein PHJA_000985800 [Phtheirospermum japonicum]
MHRSTSYSSGRSSDEFLVNFSPAVLKGVNNYTIINNDVISDDVSKKDMDLKPTPAGEKAIHLIPLVLILCALILWWFSGPVYIKLQ